MCGILVVTNSRLPPDELRSRTLRAQASLRHRGPDHSGTEIIVTPEGNHAVCHERLAIVDPSSSGNQPFLEGAAPLSVESGLGEAVTSARAALAANAEIYNHESLRTRLGARAPAGGSDCATLLPLWRELGDATAKELDGDFAFALVAKNEENDRADVYVARDPVGVDSLYIGYGGADDPTAVCFSSEAKALIDTGLCERVEPFPPGHFYTNKPLEPSPVASTNEIRKGIADASDANGGRIERYWSPQWFARGEQVAAAHDPTTPLALKSLRSKFVESVRKRLMSDVPFGVLLSGGLDSSLVASVAARLAPDASKLMTFSVGLKGAPDLAAAQQVANAIGTDHHTFEFTVQEGIDAIPEVVRHLETYDVTTIRAGTPMFLLARKIKALGVKMVLSGEGADEAFGGYLYFHKAPSAADLHDECVRKLQALHTFDCLRANKATMAWGLEVRVPFLDRDFLDAAMDDVSPRDKLVHRAARGGVRYAGDDAPSDTQARFHGIEKAAMRRAFDVNDPHFELLDDSDARAMNKGVVPTDDGTPYLPSDVLWRQKEQFSDGVGYSWIDGLKAHADATVGDAEFALAAARFPTNTPETREAYLIRDAFARAFGEERAHGATGGLRAAPDAGLAHSVPGGPSIACSTAAAIEWDAAFKANADQSGRAVAGVHDDAWKSKHSADADADANAAQTHQLVEDKFSIGTTAYGKAGMLTAKMIQDEAAAATLNAFIQMEADKAQAATAKREAPEAPHVARSR